MKQLKYFFVLLFATTFCIMHANAGNVLIYGPRLSGAPNEQTLAIAAGHTVTVVTAATWSSMSAAQFASYDAVIIPDNGCSGAGSGNTDANMQILNTNKAVWSPAITGRIVLIAADYFLHRDGQYQQVTTNAINFIAGGSGTGLLFISSCTYFNNVNVPVEFLSNVVAVNSVGSNCPSPYTVVAASHPVMAGITNAGVGNGCTSHNQWGGFPASLIPLATGSNGLPFIIASGNTCTPPTITCPSNISVNNTPGQCGANVTYPVATATGTPTPVITYSHASGSLFPVGTTTVTATATNSCGVITCTFTVTVVDNEPPTISCPGNITTNATTAGGAMVTYTAPVGTDNCSGATTTLFAGLASGSTFPIGVNTNTYQVTDAAGLTATCSFTVTVNGLAPSIVCPSNITVNNTPGQCSANVSYAATETTGIPSSTITYSIAPGSSFPVGTTSVTATATNAVGSSSCTFTVTVTDNQPPVFVNLAAAPSLATTNVPEANGYSVIYQLDIPLNADYNTSAIPYTINNSAATGITYNRVAYFLDLGTKWVWVSMDKFNSTLTQLGIPNATFNNVAWQTTVSNMNVTGSAGSGVTNATGIPGNIEMWHNCYATTAGLAGIPAGNNSLYDFNDNRSTGSPSCYGSFQVHNYGTAQTIFGYNSWDNPNNGGDDLGIGNRSGGSVNPDWTYSWNTASYTTRKLYILVNSSSCPPDITTNVTPNTCGAIVNYTTPVGTDNCSGVTTVQTAGLPSGSVFPVGLTTNTFLATAANGQTATCTFNVTVIDNQNPVINNLPANITVSALANNCSQLVTWTAPTASDNCGVQSLVSNATGGNFGLYPVGVSTVTYTATDIHNNVTTASFTITVTDNQPPTITGCPANITVNAANGTCDKQVFWNPPTASDNCSGVTFTTNHIPGEVFPVGTTVVTYIATDASNNVSTCSFNVVVVDNQNPVITCPANISVNNDLNTCGATIVIVAATATDNCAIQNIAGVRSDALALTAPYPVGSTTITWTATDVNGRTATCTQTIVVSDTQAPTITCPGNQIRSTNNNLCTYTTVGMEFDATFNENCPGATITNNLNNSNTLAGYVFPKGTTTVTWTVMDGSENSVSCSFTVTVNDTQIPTITCAGNQVRNNTNATVCTYTTVGNEFNPTAFTDNCPGSTITNNLNNTNTLAGYVFSNGVTTVTWTVTDAAGLTTVCSFTVRVNDNTAPIVTCPANQDVNLNATCAAVLPDYRSLLTVSDNCTAAGSLVITQTPAPGTALSGTGTLTVSFIVRDATNNSSTCSITVTKKDVTPPTITCPAPITVNNNPGVCGAVVNYAMPVTNDNCAGSQSSGVHVLNPGMQFFDFADNRLETQNSPGLPLTFNPTDGQKMAVFLQNCSSTHSMFQNVILPASGSVTLSFDLQYKNHSGSFSSQQFIAVELRNITTNALIQTLFKTLPGDPLSRPMTSYSFNISGLAGQQVRLQIVDATINNFFFDVLLDNIKIPGSNLTNGSFETGNYNGWTINSSNGICGTFGIGSGLGVSLSQTAGLPSGSTFPVGITTNTFVATDASGNTSTCSFNVTVIDNQAPVITCPTNINAIATSAAGATVTYTTPVGTDNCPGAVTTRIAGLASGSTFPIGTTTVTHRVTDAAGNMAQCSFTVTVVGVAPVIVCPGNITVNNTPGQCGTIVTFVATETTAIPASVITYSHQPGSFFPVGTTVVTATATNAVGVSTCTFNVVVVDNQAPIITCAPNQTQTADEAVCTAIVTVVSPVTGDNCGVASVLNNFNNTNNASGVYPVGTTAVIWTVTDIHGNTNTCTQTITVNDEEAPSITCAPNQTQTADAGQCGAQVTVVAPTTGDNCGVALVTNDRNNTPNASGVYPVGTTTVIWTVIDIHGNSSTCTQTITVTDNEAPVITCNAPISVNNDLGICGALVTYTVTSSDNCPGQTVAQTAGLPSGSIFPVGVTTNTFVVTDAHNNSSTCSFTVTVIDNERPTIVCPSNKTVNCQDDKSPVANGTATASDNCTAPSNIAISFTDASTQNINPANAGYYNYVISRTWRATDAANNFSECTQTITVQDVTAPVITCPVSVTVNCQDNNTSASTGVATGTDNCSPVIISQTQTSTQNANVNNAAHYNYVITRTWTATDVTGNASSCVQTITVQDVTAPVVACPASVTVNCQDNNTSSSTGVATGTDNCSPVAITQSQTSTQDANVNNAGHYNYVITRTWRATDVTGNFSTCVQTITVRDITAPTAICKPVTITLSGGTATITAADVNNGSSDICSPVTLSVSKTSFNCSDIGVNTVILTVKDASNNSSTCTAVVTVVGERPTCSIASIPTSTVYTGGVSTNIYLGYGPQTTNLQVSAPASGAPYTYKWIGYTTGLSSITSGNPLYTPTATGSYTFTVEVTNKYGCKSTCSITICVLDIREYSNGTPNGKVYLCHNSQTISISVNAVPSHLGNHAGDRLGKCSEVICQGTSAQFVQAEEVKDIPVVTPIQQNITNKFEVKLYPNPTPGDFNIQVITGSSEQIMVKIMNVNGTVVQASIKLTKQGLIALANKLPGGTYFVEVTQGKNREVVKLIRLN